MSEIEFTEEELEKLRRRFPTAVPDIVTLGDLAAFAKRLLAERDALQKTLSNHLESEAAETMRADRLKAERDALRECVKAADDVKGRDEFNHESEWASYDAARAKVTLP